jgi:hypothetical protein
MTETLHTPAPWHHFENCEGWTVTGPDNEVIAYCDHPLDDKIDEPSPAEANAQFIAALPELLNAVEQALQALNTAPRFRIPHLDTDSYEIAAACGRAIAKAKGGAQ